MKMPRSSSSSNQLAAALCSASGAGVFESSCSALRLLPVLDGADQPIERGDAEDDHQVAGDLGVAQPEAGVHDQGVAQAFAC